MNPTKSDNIVGDYLDTLPTDTDEHHDLNIALHQTARLWDGRDHTFDWCMKPLALLDSVNRLRYWQSASAAPDEARDAMGVLAQTIRDRAARLHDTALLDEVDRLRGLLDSITSGGHVVIAKTDLADGLLAAIRTKTVPAN